MFRPLARLSVLLLILASPLLAQEAPAPPSAPAAPSPPAPSLEANMALVRRYLQEVLSDGNLQRIDEMVSPDFVDSTPVSGSSKRGPAVVRESQGRVRGLFQSIRYRLDDLVAEGDRVVARYTVQAVRRPPEDSSEAARGAKDVEVIGISIFRIEEGRIREAWIVNDQIQLFRQLGYTVEPPKVEEGSDIRPEPRPKPSRPTG
jgi:predicted ester cyclase